MVVDDRDVLVLRVLFFPRAGLHRGEGRADDDLDVFAAETTGGAAAVHRGVSAAEDDHGLADLVRVFERDALQPVDADVNIRGAFLTAGQIGQIAATRCSGADKDGVVILLEHFFQRSKRNA